MMQSADERRRHAVSRLLFALATAAAAAAVLLGVTGGFTIRPFGVRVSAHGALRPALLALLAASLGVRWLPRARQAHLVAVAHQRTDRLLPAVAGAAAVSVLALGLAFGARTAGGSDAYGYVSESLLWLSGDLRVHQDFVAQVPWPNADWTFAPLGYRPAEGHVLVPTYPPGVPLLMAMFTKVFGRCGPYWLNPICGALLTLCAYGLGVRASGRVPGTIAALLVASSPTVLFATMWPMSDVPAAAFWAASLLIACRPTRTASAASGVIAGIAIAIRPNLAPLAVFPALMATWPLRREPRRALWQSLAFASACLPFVLFIGWVNNDLYGSPLQSGYGQTSAIFNSTYLSANLRRYPRWLWDTQGPLVFLFPVAALIRGTPGQPGIWLRRFLLAFVGAVVGCYLWYEPFDAWWYLRFILPAFAPIFVLAADAVWRGTERFGTRARIAAAVVFTCVLADHGITQARERGAFTIGEGEQKYADVGRYVATRLPGNAVVFAMQHSGSVRYYARRRTIQWLSLDGEWLDRAVAHLRASGFEPYFVLEEWEIPRFRQHFASQNSIAVVDRPAQAVHSRGVYIYETVARTGSVAPVSIPHTSGCE